MNLDNESFIGRVAPRHQTVKCLGNPGVRDWSSELTVGVKADVRSYTVRIGQAIYVGVHVSRSARVTALEDLALAGPVDGDANWFMGKPFLAGPDGLIDSQHRGQVVAHTIAINVSRVNPMPGPRGIQRILVPTLHPRVVPAVRLCSVFCSGTFDFHSYFMIICNVM